LRVRVCGRLSLDRGAAIVREADLPARQGRRLWVFLVLKRRLPVPRDEIAEAVWGDDIPDAWDAALDALVSRLRAALRPLARAAPELTIQSEGGRYVLTLPAHTVVDFERARWGLHEADRLFTRGEHDSALAEARVAMEIAGRGFLPGEEAPWIQGHRRALAEIRVHALECTVESELRRGRPEIAEREAETLVAIDPLREEGYRLLMRAMSARGNTAEAGRVLADCRRIFRGAGMNPAPLILRGRFASPRRGAGVNPAPLILRGRFASPRREQAGMAPSPETERLFRQITGATR
jgi:DNA-binding SARP family transcriptional activator